MTRVFKLIHKTDDELSNIAVQGRIDLYRYVPLGTGRTGKHTDRLGGS